MRVAFLLALLASCSDNFVVVTVDTRPSVHDATSLAITLTVGQSTRTDTRDLGAHAFPVTFAVDTGGKDGDLTISVDAIDASDNLVGRGAIQTTLSATAAKLTLDSADFVVNTTFAMDQELSTDYEAVGVQVGATADDTWTVSYHGPCDQTCDMLARRFDVNGVPVTSATAAGTNEFSVTTEQTNIPVNTSTVAAGGTDTMVFWDFSDSTLGDGVACQHLDSMGADLVSQQAIGNDSESDVVSATALSNGKFAVTWDALLTQQVIRGAIVDAGCNVVHAPTTISQGAANTIASRAHVAANGTNLLYAWIQDQDVHIRTTDGNNNPTTGDTLFLSHLQDQDVEHVRVTKMGNGFAIIVRWAALGMDSTPGHIDLYRVNAMGATQGPPTVITHNSGSDFSSVEAFGVATRGDGAVLVVWHACGMNGDGDGCGVWGRIIRPTGAPVGPELQLNTTTKGDQIRPAAVGLSQAFAVAWDDNSMTMPDPSGFAVRARVIFPPYDDATSVIGAPCGGGDPCGDGLICVPGSDATPRCYADCDPTQPPPLCPDGGSCMMGGCVF